MTIKIITQDNFEEFSSKLKNGLENFIPMLPYLRTEYNDFNSYLKFNEKSIYIIDELSETDHCLYNLYTFPGSETTLRIRLILPSNFHRRLDIIEKSIPNLIQWFNTQNYKEFMIQVLEHGEIEYYPTLSTYLLPTLYKLGFKPHYRLYMQKSEKKSCEIDVLPAHNKLISYTPKLEKEVMDFYNEEDNGYFICVDPQKELPDYFKKEQFLKTAQFIVNQQGKIVAGVFSIFDEYDDKVWIDNLKILDTQNEDFLGKYLLKIQLELIDKLYPNKDCIVYLSRENRKHVKLLESMGFYGFEFWVDAILRK